MGKSYIQKTALKKVQVYLGTPLPPPQKKTEKKPTKVPFAQVQGVDRSYSCSQVFRSQPIASTISRNDKPAFRGTAE